MMRNSMVLMTQTHDLRMRAPRARAAWAVVVQWFTACRQPGPPGSKRKALLASTAYHEGGGMHAYATDSCSAQQAYACAGNGQLNAIMETFKDAAMIEEFVMGEHRRTVVSGRRLACVVAHQPKQSCRF
jgi:hypothetical protein